MPVVNDLTINVNVAGTDQFVRFMDRLEKIANRAPVEVRREIEAAVEQLLVELKESPS